MENYTLPTRFSAGSGREPVPGRSGHDGARAFKLFKRVRMFQPAARRDVARSLGCGIRRAAPSRYNWQLLLLITFGLAGLDLPGRKLGGPPAMAIRGHRDQL